MVLLDTRHGLYMEPASKEKRVPSRQRPLSPPLSPGKLATLARLESQSPPGRERPTTSPALQGGRRTRQQQQSPPPPRAAAASSSADGEKKPAMRREALNPHWRRVMACIDRINHDVEESEKVRGEQVEGDTLDLTEVDTDTRREMLSRAGRKLHEMIDEHSQHAQHQANNLEKVDTWLIEAAHRLEQQDDDDDPFLAQATVRPDASVGAMLNKQTEMGRALSQVSMR